jgi:imidazolonepropionase-like amidohydrolase
MRAAGMTVLPGGDYGFAWTPHGSYAKDLQNFVDLFSYTPAETLLAATRDAGRLMDPSGRLGTLQPGTLADLIVVGGNPLTDVTVLADQARIVAVMKGGQFVHNRLIAGADEAVNVLAAMA